MATLGSIDATSRNVSGGHGCGGNARTNGGNGSGQGPGPGNDDGRTRYAHGGAPASCKMCLHMDTCMAYHEALATNDRFAAMRFIKLDTPVIVADRIAERCTKYAPPNMVEIAEGLKHDLR